MIIGVIDIETTGFLPTGKIVEVGIATLDTVSGLVTGVFSAVTKEPGVEEHENAWIFKNSNLTHAEVLQACCFEDYKTKIQSVIDGCDCMTAFNKRFDFGFLRNRGMEINREADCLMLTLMPVIKLPPRYPGMQYKWPNVEEAWKFLFPDLPYVEQHRGVDDAIHEARMALKMYRDGILKTSENSEERKSNNEGN